MLLTRNIEFVQLSIIIEALYFLKVVLVQSQPLQVDKSLQPFYNFDEIVLESENLYLRQAR